MQLFNSISLPFAASFRLKWSVMTLWHPIAQTVYWECAPARAQQTLTQAIDQFSNVSMENVISTFAQALLLLELISSLMIDFCMKCCTQRHTHTCWLSLRKIYRTSTCFGRSLITDCILCYGLVWFFLHHSAPRSLNCHATAFLIFTFRYVCVFLFRVHFFFNCNGIVMIVIVVRLQSSIITSIRSEWHIPISFNTNDL